jgi:hypothetical protein
MQFDTWEELEHAFLGGYGPQAQQEAADNIKAGLAGDHGVDQRVEYEGFWDDLEAGLESGAITWQDGGLAEPEDEEIDPEELAAAEQRVINDELTQHLEAQIDGLEEKIGRRLTDAEVDELVMRGADALFDGEDVDLARDHAETLKVRPSGEVRREIGAEAVQRFREEHDTGFDEGQLRGMNERQLRVFRGEQAARFAQEGGSSDEWATAKEAALATHEPSADAGVE